MYRWLKMELKILRFGFDICNVEQQGNKDKLLKLLISNYALSGFEFDYLTN